MRTVLVVEDETLVFLPFAKLYASKGMRSYADEAIQILKSRNDINTVFTDIEMPGTMDGLRLAGAVRHRWPPINIVVTSGKLGREMRRCPRTLSSSTSPTRRETC